MFLLLAAACTAPPPDEPGDTVAPARIDETTRAGCAAAVHAAAADHREECAVEYDALGRETLIDCLDSDETVWRFEAAYDATGCTTLRRWYTVYDGVASAQQIDAACDEHANPVSETHTDEQYDETGAVEHTSSVIVTYVNTYADDLLVEWVADGDWWIERTTFAYDSERRLTTQTEYRDGEVYIVTTYTYDATGNRTHGEQDASYGLYRWDAAYDAFGREIRYAGTTDDDPARVTTTEWLPDVLRESHQDIDEDDDGTIDTTLDFDWTCP